MTKQNHLNNLVEWLMDIIENQVGLITETKSQYEIETESRLIEKIQRTNDKEGIQLLLEKLIDDLCIENTDYYINNCIHWKHYLYNNPQNKDTDIKENYINELKSVWLNNIKRGTNQ